MFGNPKEILMIFIAIGIISIIVILIFAYYFFKDIKKLENDCKEYLNKPKEIIITIRKEDNNKNPNERSEPKF